MPESSRRLDAPTPPPDLTRAILARTSGNPCRRLEVLACDFVDDSLDAAQARLVRLHLDHCEACSALVGALATLRATLPTLAQADPGPGFTQAVLRATRQVPPTGDGPTRPQPPRPLAEAHAPPPHRPGSGLPGCGRGLDGGLPAHAPPRPGPEGARPGTAPRRLRPAGGGQAPAHGAAHSRIPGAAASAHGPAPPGPAGGTAALADGLQPGPLLVAAASGPPALPTGPRKITGGEPWLRGCVFLFRRLTFVTPPHLEHP